MTHKLHTLLLELTHRCNGGCVFCPIANQQRDPQDMPEDLALDLVRQAAEMGCQEVHPEFYGEPTLSPILPEVVAATRACGMESKFYSNGSRQVTAVPNEILWSLDYHTPELCAAIRPGLDFDAVCANVRDFWHEHHEWTKITAHVVVCEENRKHLRDIRKFWRPVTHLAVCDPEMPLVAGRAGLVPGIKGGVCHKPETQLIVRSDGVVVGCCCDGLGEWVVGDARTQTLAAIWEGERMMEMRRRLKDREWFRMCEHCVVKRPARAAVEDA